MSFYSLRRKLFCDMIGNFISRKSGQKCCVYGQNGKPLSNEAVKKFLNNLYLGVDDKFKSGEYNSLTDFQKSRKLVNWTANEDYTRLSRLFYFKNVFLLTDFIKEIYLLDYNSNLQQIPNISVYNRDLFKIELYTPALRGLAMRDLQLAAAINSINFDKFQLIPIKDEKQYRQEIRMISIEEEKARDNMTEETKFKNKYDAVSYERAITGGNNTQNETGCSNPEGCACAQAKSENKYSL